MSGRSWRGGTRGCRFLAQALPSSGQHSPWPDIALPSSAQGFPWFSLHQSNDFNAPPRPPPLLFRSFVAVLSNSSTKIAPRVRARPAVAAAACRSGLDSLPPSQGSLRRARRRRRQKVCWDGCSVQRWDMVLMCMLSGSASLQGKRAMFCRPSVSISIVFQRSRRMRTHQATERAC